jgi:Ser/Thr protein kinase RdoA (MazF antagonist)
MLVHIAQQFSKSIVSIEPLGNGFINDTYLVMTEEEPFVLQKINRRVFPNPEQIMANLALLNQHLAQQSSDDMTLKIPQLVKAETESTYFQDLQGEYWRAWDFIANTESLETISEIRQAEQVGKALGQFHRLTQTLDAETLFDTLPGFHIAPHYLQHYLHVKTQTKVSKNAECAEFIQCNQYIINDLETAKAQGILKVRTIHGDPKLNNFLFDKSSQHIVSLVDLDTVKPGLIHYDIGDCLRSCCHIGATDEFNLEVCQAVLTNYLKEMGAFFTGHDYQLLYPAIRLIPFELGIRFYTDYLEGNRYFKVTEPEQNLHRAIEQLRLCASIIAQEAEIKGLIKQQAYRVGK